MVRLPTAAETIARLELKPHPEGGHFRETFRDTRADANGRSASTAIYFLLARGERSHWHRIDAVEVWHYYAGHALTLQIADGEGRRTITLGPRSRCRRSAAGNRASASVAISRKHRRLDAGGMHGRARIRFCKIRTGAERVGARLAHQGMTAWRLRNMSFAAISPPPAIRIADITMFALGLAKPARIRNAVDSSGVA